MRKTKIVCTIGPACETEAKLREMMLAGMDVARINFSHGSYQEQEERINNIKKVRDELNLPVSLLMDTKGPEIRIGQFKNDMVILEVGKEFILLNKEVLGDENGVSITYKNLYKELKKDDKILINDGIIELKVKAIKGKDIVCEVIHGGKISNRKSINIPGLKLKLPSLTEADIKDIKYCVKIGVDYIAVSFVRRKEDILEIKKLLKECNAESVKIISKIENREGIDNFDEILEVSDGIMVARGDLGVEIAMHEVPVLQKKFIRKCNQAGKPVITATQMLESMVNNVKPTRAEVSDIANAIFDMTSAIMLSAESAVGKYPVECVKTMSNIAEQTEKSIDYWGMFNEKRVIINQDDYEKNLAYSVCTTAKNVNAKAIFAYTQFGNTPRLLAGFLPRCPIYAILDDKQLFRQMGLLWNVYPKIYEPQGSIENLISTSIKSLKDTGELVSDDEIVICGGGKIIKDAPNFKFNKVLGGIVKI